MWNAANAKRLNAWYESPEGDYALSREYELFQHLVSRWPRRGYTLLDVGCGTGVFLEMLWEYGFNVTGFDNNTEVLELARARLGNRVDFQLGQIDHLPFDDDSFDYVSLLSVLEYAKAPVPVLQEAIRVAKRGILVGFMNRCSAYYLLKGIPWPWVKTRRRGRWMNLWSLSRAVRTLCPDCRILSRSILFGPPSTWKATGLWGKLNCLRCSFPLGAYVGVRIDTQPQAPLTPLLLKAEEKALKTCPELRPEASRESSFDVS